MAGLAETYGYIEEHRDAMAAALQRVVRQPSISSTGEGVRDCANLLVKLMGERGIEARVMETDGLPVVFGRIASDRPDAKTLVIYTHYDVQPADPESAWESPP
ncbi:MAG TPA: hypothetical protein VKU87_04040, partial [Thermomicrobiaceae bacterium]|nr:hypothetical protein [Thermomicrobiaceae bacterium]